VGPFVAARAAFELNRRFVRNGSENFNERLVEVL
jgi:hypothetical protein